MDRQVLTAFFDELEKIGMPKQKWDPVRGRPVHAVAARVAPPPPLLPTIRTPPSSAEVDDLSAAIAMGAA